MPTQFVSSPEELIAELRQRRVQMNSDARMLLQKCEPEPIEPDDAQLYGILEPNALLEVAQIARLMDAEGADPARIGSLLTIIDRYALKLKDTTDAGIAALCGIEPEEISTIAFVDPTNPDEVLTLFRAMNVLVLSVEYENDCWAKGVMFPIRRRR